MHGLYDAGIKYFSRYRVGRGICGRNDLSLKAGNGLKGEII